MKTKIYLTVNSRGAIRATKMRPSMRAGEVSIHLTLDVPDAAFRQPFAEAHIEIPEGFIIKPEIEAWLDPVEEEV